MPNPNLINLIKSRRQFLKSIGTRLPRRRKAPKPLSTKSLEMAYYAAILKLIDPIFQATDDLLIQRLPEIIGQYQQEMRIDSYASLISRIFSDIQVNIGYEITDPNIYGMCEEYARRTSSFNKAQVDRQFKSVLGLEIVRAERWLEPLVDSFVQENVNLIKTIPQRHFNKIEGIVRRGTESGLSTAKIEQQIREVYSSMESNARLIARDQVSKFNGKLSELRQKEAGVTEYIWSSSTDERVRKRHLWANGRRFKWSDPPPVGNNGERLHPGQDYQCRCNALPVLEEFLEKK